MDSKYKIVTYGNAALREKSRRIKTITDEIRRLASDMMEVLHESKGLGLAAQQIGRAESICVIDIPPDAKGKGAKNAPDGAVEVKMPLILINAEIVEEEGIDSCEEGCLSFPEIYVTIKRAARVKVSFMDLEGRGMTVDGTGLLARALQHEIDHLNGILISDRMSPIQKFRASGKLRKLHNLSAIK